MTALWHSLAGRVRCHRTIRSVVMGVLSAFVLAPVAVNAQDSFVLRPNGCDSNTYWFHCVRRLEPEVLARIGDRVVRWGRTLSVRLKSGKVATRIDSPGESFDASKDATGRVNRSFNAIGFLKRPGLLVVEVNYYEGADFELIDIKDGRVIRLKGVPVVSPDSAGIVVVTLPDYSDTTAAVAIWRISDDGVHRVYEHAPQDWPSVSAQWRSPARIEMRRWDGTAGVPGGVFAELSLRGGRWSLTRIPE